MRLGVTQWAGALLLLLVTADGARGFAEPDVFQRLNDTGRAAYAAGRQEVVSHISPVVIVGRDVTILRDGTETRFDYTPPLYTSLKSVSHLVLGVAGLLNPMADRVEETEALWRPHLEALRAAGVEVLPQLEAFGLSGDDLARSRVLIERTLAFIDEVLASRRFTRERLMVVTREMTPLMLAHAGSAARAQIDALHAGITAWRATLGEGEWERARVFVLGPRMPRAGNLQFSYFRHAMGEAAVDRRLIYAEGIFDQAGAMSLLGTVAADRALAVLAFDDEMRMDRDLLADAADIHLKRIFGLLGREVP
ncbi:hypothetical protein [Roseomonas xinghualingensis]|uniref:hypothetical protein n=1 Tax=Roseomonas xinghualingensis TaxID=2986475 RepID=UPI0021F0CC01|nr:hypothetical protein [Roseomonas sp. SXEYE001]MCV4207971.1 hypothetical protein [Roseomonas sp. SXEYE001]